MAKAIKLKNNTYWDSTGITYNRVTLKNVLEPSNKALTTDSTYIEPSSVQINCYTIGKLCFLQINTIAFKAVPANYVNFLTGLPKPKSYQIGVLVGTNASTGKTVRVGVTTNGEMRIHWSNTPDTGDSSNKQYTGVLIYAIY